MDKASREIDTEEYNDTVIIWNHYIKMEEISQQVTRYTDTVDLYAGCFTPIAAWWTLKFYKHRQCKWQINCEEFINSYRMIKTRESCQIGI